MQNERISAFAYNTGKAIEELINQETNNLKDRNRDLEASIFLYREKLKAFTSPSSSQRLILLDYDRHFNITIQDAGEYNREELDTNSTEGV